jgi:anti-sigma regulatory factor (Ser/Thr protein kinase)
MEKRLLISRWLRSFSTSIPIYDDASVSSARERVRQTGNEWNAPKELVESVALIASELTRNQLVHAKQGYFAVRSIERDGNKGLEVIAADLGPGIEKPNAAIAGTPESPRGLGAGLSAVARFADEVDFDSRLTEGTCIVARKFQNKISRAADGAIFGRPFPGEVISGDDAGFFHTPHGFLAVVCDGLGHGPEAREASHEAVAAAGENPDAELVDVVTRINARVARTRGCAIGLLRFDKRRPELECVSAGDVHTQVYGRTTMHAFAAMPMVLRGADLPRRRIRVDGCAAEPNSIVVLFTDGLTSKTSLRNRPDLLRQSPVAMAQHLIETEARPNDDAMVLIARLPG